jgi:hypothetical protein
LSAKNANPGTIQEYFSQNRILKTGLDGAFLITFFPDSGLIAWNPEESILPGEKPACLNLFGCSIIVQIVINPRKMKGEGVLVLYCQGSPLPVPGDL